MANKICKYIFNMSIPSQQLEDTFTLAMLAVISLHGRQRVFAEGVFHMDKAHRICVIDASTTVGHDLDRIFIGYATIEYGEDAVKIERS